MARLLLLLLLWNCKGVGARMQFSQLQQSSVKTHKMSKMEENGKRGSVMTAGLRDQRRLRKTEENSRAWMTRADITAVYLKFPKSFWLESKMKDIKIFAIGSSLRQSREKSPCTILMPPSEAARNKLCIFQSWAFIHNEAAASMTCSGRLAHGCKQPTNACGWNSSSCFLFIFATLELLFIEYSLKNYSCRTHYRNLQTNKQTCKYIQQNVSAKASNEWMNPTRSMHSVWRWKCAVKSDQSGVFARVCCEYTGQWWFLAVAVSGCWSTSLDLKKNYKQWLRLHWSVTHYVVITSIGHYDYLGASHLAFVGIIHQLIHPSISHGSLLNPAVIEWRQEDTLDKWSVCQ